MPAPCALLVLARLRTVPCHRPPQQVRDGRAALPVAGEAGAEGADGGRGRWGGERRRRAGGGGVRRAHEPCCALCQRAARVRGWWWACVWVCARGHTCMHACVRAWACPELCTHACMRACMRAWCACAAMQLHTQCALACACTRYERRTQLSAHAPRAYHAGRSR